MRSHEIFQQMSPALAAQIFTFMQMEQKPVYKAAIQGLANQRNLRGVFIERKPPAERFPWMQAALARRVSDSLASHLLQAWLLGANKQMLCDFLDAMEIKHEEDGTVEELPSAPPKEKIAAAVSQLLAKYPAETVAVYLHAFRDMDSAVQWPALDEILTEEPQLRLEPLQKD
jgi:phenylpyruvate tautomerase PptA (4-oxalocrotonate tautomerase family)